LKDSDAGHLSNFRRLQVLADLKPSLASPSSFTETEWRDTPLRLAMATKSAASVPAQDLTFAARRPVVLKKLTAPVALQVEQAVEPCSSAEAEQPVPERSGDWTAAAVAAPVADGVDKAEQLAAVVQASVDKSAGSEVERRADERQPAAVGKSAELPDTEAVPGLAAEERSTVAVDIDAAEPGIEQPADSGSCTELVVVGTAEWAVATAAAELPGSASGSAGRNSFVTSMSSSRRSAGTD
jgi:hypothetical protein